MKKAIIVHRWDGNIKEKIYQYIKTELEKKGFSVEIPKMPNAEKPTIEEWVCKLYDYKIDKETYFIGHSIGAQAIMRYLERIDGELGGIVFIAPWTHLQGIEGEGQEVQEIAAPWLTTAIDFVRVREKTSKIVCIFSDNDYYVDLNEREIFKDNLGAEIVTEHKKGHFTEDDKVTELPILIDKLLKMAK